MDNLTRAVDAALPARDYSQLSQIFQSGWQTVGQGEQRSLAAYFIHAAVTRDPTFVTQALQSSPDDMLEVFQNALGHLPATVEEGADNGLRKTLFTFLTQTSDNPDYTTAARILGTMRMESDDTNNPYYMDAAARTNVFVQMAECFLTEDEIAESDAAVNKAGSVVEQIPNKEEHQGLILRYKSTYARVLDANRKFLAAAQRYHELSQSAESLIEADDLLAMLGRAVTCAVLAPSGPQRARILQLIGQDGRLSQLEAIPEFATHSTLLRKMQYSQIIQPAELTQFESSLADHQKAIMGDGLTILERGVVEHNLVSVAQLYDSIYLEELALVLGVSKARAEKIAVTMIMDGSLDCTIDQVVGLLEFTPPVADETDAALASFCHHLNRVTEGLSEMA
jgi:COP9 signalosome complex subunit 4